MACDRVKAAAEGDQLLSGSAHDARAYVQVSFRNGATSLLRARCRVRRAPLRRRPALSGQRYAPALQQYADWPVRGGVVPSLATSQARAGSAKAEVKSGSTLR